MGKKDKESPKNPKPTATSATAAASALAAPSAASGDDREMPVLRWLTERIRQPNASKADAITTLNLGSRALRSLPDDFGTLSALVSLDLRHNRIEALPPSFGQLVRLETLSLCSVALANGAFPAALLHLSAMRDLDVSGTGLTTLPADLGARLPSLTKLDLSRNALTALPVSLAGLAALVTLMADSNRLACLPDALFADGAPLRASLRVLRLDGNALTTVPASLGSLPALEELVISCNQLTALPDGFGSGLGALHTLDISSNPIAALPVAGFEGMKSLGSLLMRHCSATNLPPGIGTLESLEVLDADYNAIKALPPFSATRRLTTLRLKGNAIRAVPSPFVCGDGAGIDLSNNAIEEIASLDGLAGCIDLNLGGNKIKALPADGLAVLNRVTRLILSENALTSLPESVSQMVALTELDCRCCQITSLPVAPFCPPALRKLILCGNKLEQFHPTIYGSLGALQVLNLAGNRLTQLAPGFGAAMGANLKELYLGGNRFETLPDEFGALGALNQLFLGWNLFKSVPASVAAAPRLTILHLSGNPLTSFPDSFKNIKGLKQLYVSAVPCMTSFPGWIAQCKSLEVLDISYNAKLSSLPSSVSACNFLERLDISGCDAKFSIPKEMRSRGMVNVICHAMPPSSPQMYSAMSDMQGRRRNMEDAQCILHPFRGSAKEGYASVFDGHGGDKAAILACSEHAAILEKRLASVPAPKESNEPDAPDIVAAVQAALRDSFNDLEEKMVEPAIGSSGCTGVVVYVRGGRVYTANAGDARAVMMTPDRDDKDRAFALSIDHKPDTPDEEARIRALGGRVKADGRVQGMLAVSRALGDLELKPYISHEPFVSAHTWLAGNASTHVVMACDGVWDVMSNSRAAQVVKSVKHPGLAAVKLRDHAYMYGSTDNISVTVIFAFGGASAPVASGTGKSNKKK